jgi:hypothetical protein
MSGTVKEKLMEKNFFPFIVFFVYLAAAFIVILIFRFIFPDGEIPLPPYAFKWRLFSAVATFVRLFPALAFSALVIPFGMEEHTEGGYAGGTFVGKKGFSSAFLQYLTWPVISACVAAALYGILFFLALPLADGARATMSARGALYQAALEKAHIPGSAAEQYARICRGIWPGSPALEKIKLNSGAAGGEMLSGAAGPQAAAGEGEPVTTAEAMARAEKAYAEERWFDAHWLATLAERLAPRGSAEIAPAQALAARAWNKIGELEPNAREQERFDNYRMKRDAYNAMLSQDWLSAYYTFRELSVRTPDDPDVQRYLADSARGLSAVAFFTDEIDFALGSVVASPVFSFPGEGGSRLALRFASVALEPDCSFAWSPEIVAADGGGFFLNQALADYAKIVPVTVSGPDGAPAERTALLLRAVDRQNESLRHEPRWISPSGEEVPGAAQILLGVSYDDFLLAARAKQAVAGKSGAPGLTFRELFAAEKKAAALGAVPEVYRAEALRRLCEPVFFLPLSVMALFLGWSFRARKKPRYVYVPMLPALPAVLSIAVLFCRNALADLSVILALSFAFRTALIIVVASSAVFFLAALVLLAAQHG